MAAVTVEDRLSALEAEVARLKAKIEGGNKPRRDWLDMIWGSFANDPIYEEAMRIGRDYRESQRPKPRKPRGRS